ncbi:MAG: glutathione S-transferase family protein [Rhodobacteraceae bacterium]|nr:glutathione S-transferase family protein [Paracoccaceae bacterium]MCY4140492.1 glutathione S-transferase family protein [Paracoccaceae bacterium]
MIRMYCFGESGNSYKATLPLHLSGLEWTPVYVDFFGGEARTPEFRALNPMGEVPVMVDGDTTLTQSGAIQDYISEKTGKFGGKDTAEKREILRWVLWDNHKFSSPAGMVRFLMNFLPAEKRPRPVIEFMQHRLKFAYAVLDGALSEREWLVGDGPTMADFSCCGYLFYPEPFGFDRRTWPSIDAWLDRVSSLDGWKHPYDLMPGNPSDRS